MPAVGLEPTAFCSGVALLGEGLHTPGTAALERLHELRAETVVESRRHGPQRPPARRDRALRDGEQGAGSRRPARDAAPPGRNVHELAVLWGLRRYDEARALAADIRAHLGNRQVGTITVREGLL